MNLANAVHDYDDTQLLHYLDEEIVKRGNYDDLFQTYETIHTIEKDNGRVSTMECTLLQKALNEGRSDTVIFKLMDMGGSKLVKQRNKEGYSVLHFAYMTKYTPPLHVISRLIEVGGGKEMVMATTYRIWVTALHTPCDYDVVPFDIISELNY